MYYLYKSVSLISIHLEDILTSPQRNSPVKQAVGVLLMRLKTTAFLLLAGTVFGSFQYQRLFCCLMRSIASCISAGLLLS